MGYLFVTLIFLVKAYNIEIISFVLMNNHFHLLIRTPLGNLAQAMLYFMRETSRSITAATNRINQTYGAPYHPTIIETERYFRTTYKYIYRNPVEAGICRLSEEYPYSTLSGLLGFNKMIIPVVEDFLLFEDVEDTLKWLNQSSTAENYKAVKYALGRSKFWLPQDSVTRKSHYLENNEY